MQIARENVSSKAEQNKGKGVDPVAARGERENRTHRRSKRKTRPEIRKVLQAPREEGIW